MRITLHRPNRIGGCITEIESSKGTKIFIDLGHNLPRGDEEAPDEYASTEAIAELTKDAKAVFYTHIHGDHIELFKYVPEGIDQYVGPLAHKLMVAKYKHMTYANDLKENRLLCLKKLDPFKKYHKGWNITVDDIIVTPFQVSHSLSDSYLLRVKCDGKTILHTGDFRGHGYLGEGIYKVIDKFHIAGHVDVLITEGTNIDNSEGNTAFNPSTFRFVEQFREKGCAIEERAHTSGHASKQDLIRLCRLVNPEIIVPIHKDETADIKSILPDELKSKVREYHYGNDGIEIVFDPPQKYHASCWCDAVGATAKGYYLHGEAKIE